MPGFKHFLMGEEIQQECQNWVKVIEVHHTILSPLCLLGNIQDEKLKLKDSREPTQEAHSYSQSKGKDTITPAQHFITPGPKSGGRP